MSDPAVPAALPPELAARLAQFARACKAAARAVSLYPAAHPAITAALARIAQASGALAEHGPFTIQVHADELRVGDARLPKTEPAAADVAALLHRHLVGALTFNAGADAASWRTLLQLLARDAEEVRNDGGIARLWGTAGGPSIEIREIDYLEVLREREGLAATIDRIIEAALAGPELPLDDSGLQALLAIVGDPARLRQLVEQLERTALASPQGVELQTAAFLTLVRGLVEYVSRTAPGEMSSVFAQLGHGARHFSVDAMISLLGGRARPEAMAGRVNVVGAIVEHMGDSSIAGFVADAVVVERGASERLAHAFTSLVPEFDRQRQLLALAREDVQPELRAEEGFDELWQRVEGMLTSYSDARYVSDDYARELSQARTQPTAVEQTTDDPPERIAAWLSTVSDSALRDLDRDLLSDLLAIEADPLRWRDIADTVVTHADDLVRVDYFDQAAYLIEQVVRESERLPERRPHAAPVLERFGRGSLLRHLPGFLRRADDEMARRLRDLCHTIGTSLIVPLAEALAAEQDARARRRLRDLVVAFGPPGAEAVAPLLNAGNWEVRRTAAFLLREFGGAAGLKEMVPLLTDAEPLVQREAVQALVLNGGRDASRILLSALLTSRGTVRSSLLKEVLTIRDERAGPLYVHALQELHPRQLPDLYAAALDGLGTIGGDDAVSALEAALRKGDWWTPIVNRRLRGAAAHALRRIGTPAALAALRRASNAGPSGARAAARAELERAD